MKNKAAQALAKLAAEKMTPDQRSARARTASRAWWDSATPEQRAAWGARLAEARKAAKLRKISETQPPTPQ